MNKKQREAKRKNAQAHQKKVKDLAVQRIENRNDRKRLITRELFKADRVIVEIPTLPVDPLSDVFGPFFAKHLKQGSGVPLTRDLEALMGITDPRSIDEFPVIDIETTYPIIGRKCK